MIGSWIETDSKIGSLEAEAGINTPLIGGWIETNIQDKDYWVMFEGINTPLIGSWIETMVRSLKSINTPLIGSWIETSK